MGHKHGRMFKEWVWLEWLGLCRSGSGRELGCLLRVQGSHGRGRGRKGSSVDPWIAGGWRLEGGEDGSGQWEWRRRREDGRGLPASEPHLRWRAQEGGCVGGKMLSLVGCRAFEALGGTEMQLWVSGEVGRQPVKTCPEGSRELWEALEKVGAGSNAGI